jgi:hypothetical protein
LKTVLSHVIVPILMGLVMAVAYLGGFHKPVPNHVPVAIVGNAQQVAPLVSGLKAALGDELDVRTVETQAEAESQVKSMDLAGAFVPGAKAGELLVASGRSDSSVSMVTKVFSEVTLKEGVPLKVTNEVPLDPSDPIGQNGFFFLVALTVGAYATSIAIGVAGASRRFVDRIALALGAAVLIASVSLAIATWAYGMFTGHAGTIWLVSVLYCASVLFIGVGLHPIVGRFATLAYSAIFVAFNFTSSGGVFNTELQPGFYGWLHSFWIGAGYVESLRHIMYFPNLSSSGPMGILFSWLVVGLLCLAAGYAVDSRRRSRLAASTGVGSHAVERLTPEEDEELQENVAV